MAQAQKTYPQLILKEFWVPVIYLVSKTMREAPGLESSPRVTWQLRNHLRNPTNTAEAAGVYQSTWLNCRLQRACLLPDSHHGLQLKTLMPFSRGLQKEAQTLKKFMKVPQILKVQIQSPESLTLQSGISFPGCTKRWTTDI